MSSTVILQLARGASGARPVAPVPPSPTPTGTLRQLLSSEAQSNVAEMEAARSAAWLGYQGQPFTNTATPATISALQTAIDNARASKPKTEWWRVIWSGGSLSGTVALGTNQDYGGDQGGGLILEADSLATICKWRINNIRAPNGLVIRNTTFALPGGYAIITDPPSGATAANSARLIVEGCQFGTLFEAGKTEAADWQSFHGGVQINHAHTAIFRNNKTNGATICVEMGGCRYWEVSGNEFQKFFLTTIRHGPGFNENTMPAGVFSDNVMNGWVYNNVWFNAFDRSDLYWTANSDIPHTDMVQSQPSEYRGWTGRWKTIDGTYPLGQANSDTTPTSTGDLWVMDNGHVYSVAAGRTQRGSTQPTHLSGTVNNWTYVKPWVQRRFNVIVEKNYGACSPNVPAGYSINLDRNQLMLYMDSANDYGVIHPGTITIFGNRLSSNGAYGVRSQGMRILAEYNVQVGPATSPDNTNGLPAGLGDPFRAPTLGNDSRNAATITRNNLGFTVQGVGATYTGTFTDTGSRSTNWTNASSGSLLPGATFQAGKFSQHSTGWWIIPSLASAASGALTAAQVKAALEAELTPLPAYSDKGPSAGTQ